MKHILSNIAIFTVGAAIGSAVTWRVLKSHYEEISRQEIDEVREFYARKNAEKSESEKVVEVGEALAEGVQEGLNDIRDDKANPLESLLDDYKNVLKKADYTQYSKEEEEVIVCKPYVISPEEYGECVGYDAVELTYYADGILTDDMDEIIEDVDNVVGRESLNHFGEYEDDSVHVRNDELKTDYEILLDTRAYRDVIDKSPHLAEDE